MDLIALKKELVIVGSLEKDLEVIGAGLIYRGENFLEYSSYISTIKSKQKSEGFEKLSSAFSIVLGYKPIFRYSDRQKGIVEEWCSEGKIARFKALIGKEGVRRNEIEVLDPELRENLEKRMHISRRLVRISR